MKNLIQLLDSKPVTYLRLAGCALTVLMIAATLFGFQGPTPKEIYDLSIEHRLSSLEEKVSGISEELREMNEKNWVVMLGILGLSGEAGLRIVKGRSKRG